MIMKGLAPENGAEVFAIMEFRSPGHWPSLWKGRTLMAACVTAAASLVLAATVTSLMPVAVTSIGNGSVRKTVLEGRQC